jgi:hypothetical protein
MAYDQTSSSATYGVVDRLTGDEDVLPITGNLAVSGSRYPWRPCRDELWLPWTEYDTNAPYSVINHLTVWAPGVPVRQLDGVVATALERLPDLDDSMFSRAGTWVFTLAVDQGGRAAVSALSADDPSQPAVPLNPAGTTVDSYWELADGRLVFEAAITGNRINDIYIVDPARAERRALASGGHVLSVGATRLLALLDWLPSSGSGTLTLVDLETGAHTVIAENVFAAALDRRTLPGDPDGDPLGSGARLAYLVRNRLDSPWDGLWMTTLP